MKECKLTDDGARTLRKLKRENLVISGLGDKGLLTRYTFGRGGERAGSGDADKSPPSGHKR